MMSIPHRLAGVFLIACAHPVIAAQAETPDQDAPRQHSADAAKKPASGDAKKTALDHSGKARSGKASFYAKKFNGRKMADGTRMDPNADVAASKTLPLGTTARVTNLESGKSAVVEIRDRGPYVHGRIVDVTPKVAEKLEMTEDGVVPVVVKPIAVPQPDGSIKPGVGATERNE